MTKKMFGDKKCESCSFWRKKQNKDYGFCHRFPPQATEGGRSDWPETHAMSFCGEHRDAVKGYETRSKA